MAVEVIPLGRPDLGMTRAELLDTAWGVMEVSVGLYAIFFTLLFAYIVAMYLAGSKLSKVQYSIGNILFLLTMFSAVTGTHETWQITLQFLDDAYEGPMSLWNEMRAWINTSVMVVSVALAIWFGSRVRHQAVD